MKEKLKKLIATKMAQRDALNASMINSDSKEERAAIGETLKALAKEIADCEEMLASVDAPAEPAADTASADNSRSFNPLGTMSARAGVTTAENELEARKAFQHFMATGERRADASNTTGADNISTVIPQNLVDKILEKYEQLGEVYNRVTKTSFAVGQSIPVDSVKPTATWVNEGATSDSQKKTLGALITFAHNKLRCEIRYSEEVGVMTLAQFEALFVKQVGEAMVRAIEAAIVDGNGTGKPTGILTVTPDTGKAITIAEGVAPTYATLCECEAAVPLEKEAGAKWCMTKQTFMKFVGMVDSNGQPIARINYGLNGKPERYLLGREVVLYVPQTGSTLKSWSAAVDADALIAFIFDFGDYVLNTNYDLGISHAKDWDNEDHKTKAVLGCDGKVIDKTSLVTLTIDAA